MNKFDINNQPKHNPFTVPEGYFDNLTARIMEQIPETSKTTLHTAELKPQKSRRWIGWTVAAAACVAVAALILNVPDSTTADVTTKQVALLDDDSYAYDEQYEQEVMEYAMVDNSDVYNYLAGIY